MKRYTLLVITFYSALSYAGSINLDIPERANQEFYLLMNRGIVTDTLVHARYDAKGKYTFTPEKDRLPEGIIVLSMPPYTWFEFVWSGKENFTLSCDGEYPHSGNVVFTGSTENNSLNRWFREQHQRDEKQRLCEAGLQLYKSPEFQHFIFQKEKQRLEEEDSSFADTLKNSALYAARYMEIRNFLSRKAAPLAVNYDTAFWAASRSFLRDSLDMQALYGSGQWFNVINASLELYANGSRYHNRFGEDMVAILKRIDSQEVFETLSNNLFIMCEQFDWQDAEKEIVNYLSVSGRLKNPQGKLQQLLAISRVSPGRPAPAITGLPALKGTGLLIFYESGCHNCEVQLEEIKSHYDELKQKGICVVSVSADSDKHVFDYHSKDFPWPDKLCDYKGFEGENFKNYGVIGTPTFYVIDENGIIQGRYAKLIDTGII